MAASSAAVAAARAGSGSAARMQAWRVHAYGGPAELRLDTARLPPLRAPDELLVRVSAAGLNPIDIAMTGGYGRYALGALRRVAAAWSGGGGADGVELPLTAGRECCGCVVRAGPAARLPPGARVWAVVPPHRAGSHAEYVVVRDCWTGPAPSSMDDVSAGGTLYAALTACSALRAAGLAPGAPPATPARAPRVLLLGLGGVGSMALQLLVAGGAQVVVGCSGTRAQLATQLGAVAALDRTAPDYDRRLEEGGPCERCGRVNRHYLSLCEPSSTTSSLNIRYEAILDCAGLGGREAGARRWRFARYVTLTSPLLRETDARGAWGALPAAAELAAQCAAAAAAARRARPAPAPPALPPHVRWAYFMLVPGDIEMLHRLVERGQLAAAVDRAYGWRRAAAAYARQAAGRARGKLVLDFTDQSPPAPAPGDAPPDAC